MNLYERLMWTAKENRYPMHMPGHKRAGLFTMANPYAFDVTEIDGTDNLHQPEGEILWEMEQMKQKYGTMDSYLLVNGSTCGILAAISACCHPGDTIVIARNCHRSVYHAVELLSLKPVYVYPEIDKETGICLGISSEEVKRVIADTKPACVVLTSPTYEGVVSNIRAIAEIVHEENSLLVVDEAHGAHFAWSDKFPETAMEQGADLVIESLHKTLPALTQTAVLHRASDRVLAERVEHYLEIFETSSPSYVLMGSISQCMQWMREYADTWFETYFTNLIWFREHAEKWQELRLWDNPRKEPSKLVVLTGEKCSGTEAAKWLREEFQIEVEMAAAGYILAMTSLADSRDGFVRLMDALTKIDERLQKISFIKEKKADYGESVLTCPEVEMLPVQAVNAPKETKPVNEAEGFVSAEYGMVYPPGIPFLVPGEKITKTVLDKIENAKKAGLHLFGFADVSGQTVQVVKEEKKR